MNEWRRMICLAARGPLKRLRATSASSTENDSGIIQLLLSPHSSARDTKSKRSREPALARSFASNCLGPEAASDLTARMKTHPTNGRLGYKVRSFHPLATWLCGWGCSIPSQIRMIRERGWILVEVRGHHPTLAQHTLSRSRTLSRGSSCSCCAQKIITQLLPI